MATTLIITLLTLSFSLLTADAIVEQQLDATEAALRSAGYNLFGNAIATSDLRYRLLSATASNASFTLFSPLDSTLYSLDMASPATTYTQTLYYHVVTGHHTFADLQNFCYLDTLLSHYSVLVNQNAQNDTVVDGVSIALPNLFVGPRIAVHGLNGILIPGELGLDEPVNDADFHPDLSPQALIDSDFSSSPATSPAVYPVNDVSTAIAPSPDFFSPRIKPNLDVVPRSPPPETKNKSSKRKNRGKLGRSKGRRRRDSRDNHGRFSKFNDHHPPDF